MQEALTIGQVSVRLGVPATTLRHWEKALGELFRPDRSPGGQRRYGEEDVALLERVQSLSTRMRLVDIRAAIERERVTKAEGGGSWTDKVVLITGGTGSFGKAFTRLLLTDLRPKAVRIFSRDELKQFEMDQELKDEHLRFLIGDVRDAERLDRAMKGVNIVVHAAALKQVPSCEYNPFEAIKTNILGAKNVIDAAINNSVEKVLALSSDKAVNPINLYGATKLCADKLFVQGNSYVGERRQARFACVRYGNVIASRGSVIPVFLQQRRTGCLTVTDERMTRFWITLEDAARFVARCVEVMEGGEIFSPKIPSMKITDLARAIAPHCEYRKIGIRAGEKLHEVLITEEDGYHTIDYDGMYVILPSYNWWSANNYSAGVRVKEGFVYSSDKNDRWLTVEELRRIVRDMGFVSDQDGRRHSLRSSIA